MMTDNPQRQPFPKKWTAHEMRVIDAIIDGDQVTTKKFVEDLIAALPDPLQYKGVWDASTNTPTLLNTDTGVTGYVYRCNVAGSVDFGAGSITFTIGDFAVNNGTIWEKWDAGDVVSSVFTRVGDVIAQSGDYTPAQLGITISDQIEVYEVSDANGSDSSPNDGSHFAPYKTVAKVITVMGSHAEVLVDSSRATSEAITIPAGKTLSLKSLTMPEATDAPSFDVTLGGAGANLTADGVVINSLDCGGYVSTIELGLVLWNAVSNEDGNQTFKLSGTRMDENVALALLTLTVEGWGIKESNGEPMWFVVYTQSYFNDERVRNVGTPTDSTDAATKGYVDGHHVWDGSLNAGEYFGFVITETAGEILADGELCEYRSDGKMYKADATALANCDDRLFINIFAKAADVSGLFLAWGLYRVNSWSWSIADKLFISTTAGAIATSPPVSPNINKQIGVAIASNIIGFFPDTYVHIPSVPSGTSFPGSPSDGDLFNRTDLDMVFRYDGGRTKWLSEHSEIFACGRSVVPANADVYSRVGDGTMSSTSGLRMPRNGTIIAVTVENQNSVTRTIDFRVNNSLVNRIQLALTAAVGGKVTNGDLDFSADDLLQVLALVAAANAMGDMISTIEVKWRA